MKELLSEKFRSVARGLHSSGHADKAAGWHFAADEVEKLERQLEAAERNSLGEHCDEIYVLHNGERYCNVSVCEDLNKSHEQAAYHAGFKPVKALVPRPKG